MASPTCWCSTDLDQDTSFWVHVTAELVSNAPGRAARSWCRRTRRSAIDQADDLFDVACKQKAAPELEGTAFAGLARRGSARAAAAVRAGRTAAGGAAPQRFHKTSP